MMKVPVRLYLSGGLGTALGCGEESGKWSNDCVQKNPQSIKDACKRFVCCGSDVIQTATYQVGYVDHCTLDQSRKRVERAVNEACELAKETRNDIIATDNNGTLYITKIVDQFVYEKQILMKSAKSSYGWRLYRRLYIVGCVGPLGACLEGCQEYNGDYIESMTRMEVVDFHRQRVDTLKQRIISGDLDFIAVETIPSLREAEILCEMLKGVPFYISMSCKDELHTCNGERLSGLSASLTEDVIAVGVNCCRPQHVFPLLESLKDSFEGNSKMPRIVAYANNGDNWVNNECTEAKDKDKTIKYLDQWLKIGVGWIGGCCGVECDELRGIHKYINEYDEKINNDNNIA